MRSGPRQNHLKFLYIRRVPMFGHVIRIIDRLASKLPETEMHDFLASFSAAIGQEARELLQHKRGT